MSPGDPRSASLQRMRLVSPLCSARQKGGTRTSFPPAAGSDPAPRQQPRFHSAAAAEPSGVCAVKLCFDLPPDTQGFLISSFLYPPSPTFFQLCCFGEWKHYSVRVLPAGWRNRTGHFQQPNSKLMCKVRQFLYLKKCESRCLTTHRDGKLVAAETSPCLLLIFFLLSAEIFFLSFKIISRKHLLIYSLFWLRDRKSDIVVKFKQDRYWWYPEVTEKVIKMEPEEKQTWAILVPRGICVVADMTWHVCDAILCLKLSFSLKVFSFLLLHVHNSTS